MMKRPNSFFICLLLSLFILLPLFTILTTADSHFEGFEADDNDDDSFDYADSSDLPLRTTPPPVTRSASVSDPLSDPDPDPLPSPSPDSDSASPSSPTGKTTTASTFDYWDEDEFEGLPPPESTVRDSKFTDNATPAQDPKTAEPNSGNDTSTSVAGTTKPKSILSYKVEIVCVSFLIIFAINYFTGKTENENLALAWAAKFATKDSIFEKNFSLLGVGEGDDSPLLLKEGQNVFKFYASGRRYCQGLLATMELKSRHDLMARLYNMVVPCRDEITFEVYMNEDAMDHVVFALAKKKAAKTMQKEVRDLQRFAGILATPTGNGGRKWVIDDLSVISESKEVAGDLITEAVLDQVFGEKAFEKYGKDFISMHFSDQHSGAHKKVLLFKYALPDASRMGDMTRLVTLVPYYIDLIGRYKLSSMARSKTEVARSKAAQEAYKELQNVRQEALQRKKADRKKMMEEAEAKLSAEAVRKKEAKERARQMKKGMPKIKMTRAH
ncbi:hypothetical protein HS088_TW08G00590 [Tripterygium wilfordii]|uniref:Coiled-coil domain-containing protein 47 n=1 Tax=Tripterygium wilfordii TaxID=458696 RepID=A0A7J7DCC0_TRIWF|nr:uncharacterized protein At5g49945-like [Tripterygium wilfordii]KAF5744002.1 hypothetical protein HS088_TW08G00590 [Tripterygium wilfordii]